MAKYYSSTFGKISGKHGNAVAVIMKDGSTYLRKYTKPSNPRTDKQQAHRAKFALSSKALAPFNPIFKETIGATSGISIARSHAFKNAIVGEYPNISIDYKKLMFSFGTLEKLQNATYSLNSGIISINWDFKKKHNCHGNDSVSLVVFNKNNNQALHIKDIAIRKKKHTKIDIHESWTNGELYLWAYVKQGNNISDSIFVDDVYHNNSNGNCNAVLGTHDNNIKGTMPNIINQAIMAFILMLYNLLGLFRQVATNIDMQNTLSTFTNRASNTSNRIEYIYNEKMPLLHSEGITWSHIHTISKGILKLFRPIQKHFLYQYAFIRNSAPLLTYTEHLFTTPFVLPILPWFNRIFITPKAHFICSSLLL